MSEDCCIATSIENKIRASLNPLHLKVEDESHLHNFTKNSPTHFKIQVVSQQFAQKTQLQRHRIINAIIAEEIAKIRAYTLYTFSPEEWELRQYENLASSACSKKIVQDLT